MSPSSPPPPLTPHLSNPGHYAPHPRLLLDMYATSDHLAHPEVTAQHHPPYCHRPSLPRPLLTCADRHRLAVGRQLGAGKSKTVHVAVLDGERLAYKSAALAAQRGRGVRQNPFEERKAVVAMEFNKTLLMDGTAGVLRARGACFTATDAWAAYSFGERGAFGPDLVATASEADSLLMAQSVARVFACLEHHPYGFAFISDNKPEQFVVHEDWTVELADVDGLRFYAPGSRGRMGGKTCRTNLDCVANRRRPDFVLSPDNGCDVAAGHCVGEDSRSMVFVLGHMFLAPLASRAPALRPVADRCQARDRTARPTAAEVARAIERLHGAPAGAAA
eukprot:EG_transcript_18399